MSYNFYERLKFIFIKHNTHISDSIVMVNGGNLICLDGFREIYFQKHQKYIKSFYSKTR